MLHITYRWGVAFVAIGVVYGLLALATWEPIRKRLNIKNLAFVRIADWFDAKSFRVHYISSRWIEAPKELLVEASFRCNIGGMAVEDIELKVGRTRIPYEKLSRSGVAPFRLPIVVGEEKIFNITFLIPEKLKGKSHKMRLVVTAGDKRYLSELDYLNLDYRGMVSRMFGG